MRRKIACYITIAVTALFMVARIVTAIHPNLSLGFTTLEDATIATALVSMAVIAVLTFSRNASLTGLNDVPRPFSGWAATYCGALLIMSVILDIFCWTIYGQVPPPGEQILNNVDRYTLIFSLIFGIVGGIFFILQGFNWMAGITRNKAIISWLSLAPILWMWFRLARYEISYASTIDISHSFFDFASLVTGSLFFLQLARVITGVGTQPKNSLIVFGLFTGISSLSSAPLTFYYLSQGTPISSMLIALVDATIGLLALVTAIVQIFKTNEEGTSVEPTPEEVSMAWTTPEKERLPQDPPFAIDEKLPVLDKVVHEATSVSVQETDESAPSVDDILAELNKDIF